MKRIMLIMLLALVAGTGFAAVSDAADNWAVNFGFSYPKYYSVNIDSLDSNYGGFVALRRGFTENVALRLKGGFKHMEGQWYDSLTPLTTEKTNLLTGDLDLMFYFTPCSPASPYVFGGAGGNYKTSEGAQSLAYDSEKFGYQLNTGVGVEFSVSNDWNVTAEFGYHVTNNSVLDGTIVPYEVNGLDSFITMNIGVSYIFGRGLPSEMCSGNNQGACRVDYDRIEDMIKLYSTGKKQAPESYIISISDDRLLLVGVRFDFDKSALLPESYTVLNKGLDLLKKRPEINVEVEGYTDYVGTGAYNQRLSLERAKTVRNYLISKGIDANRLKAVGYGMNNPLEDNSTPEGRAMNRRIVFKVIKK